MGVNQKILIVSDAWEPQTNGVVRTYQELNKELLQRGCKVKIIGPADFPLAVSMPGYAEIKLVLFSYAKIIKYIHDYAPVSYTHLRAHETGRNLVCRLLL